MWPLRYILSIMAALLCANAHQALMPERYARHHTAPIDVAAKRDRLMLKLHRWNQTGAGLTLGEGLDSVMRVRNHTAGRPSADMVEGFYSIFQHVLDPLYEFMTGLVKTAQEPPLAVHHAASAGIPNLLY